jgi:dCMP deaminase
MMRFAYTAAMRATCPRRSVGAIIMDSDHRIVATGYNGAARDLPSCDQVGCQMVEGHCVRTLHAESNAIDFAGRFAQRCTLFVTVTPCWDCAKRIVNSGITRVCYDEHYESRYGKSTDVPDYLREGGVIVDRMDESVMTRYKSLMALLVMPVDATSTGPHASIVPPAACAIHRFEGDGPCVVCGTSGS